VLKITFSKFSFLKLKKKALGSMGLKKILENVVVNKGEAKTSIRAVCHLDKSSNCRQGPRIKVATTHR
jgi:hypothetical protein